MDVWDAVVASSWESDGSGDTVLEGLSLWSVWAVLKRTGGWVFGSSWNINVSWLHVCWPWFNLSKSFCFWSGSGSTIIMDVGCTCVCALYDAKKKGDKKRVREARQNASEKN